METISNKTIELQNQHLTKIKEVLHRYDMEQDNHKEFFKTVNAITATKGNLLKSNTLIVKYWKNSEGTVLDQQQTN